MPPNTIPFWKGATLCTSLSINLAAHPLPTLPDCPAPPGNWRLPLQPDTISSRWSPHRAVPPDRLLQSASALTPHPSCRETDQLLATGEQTSAALLAITLQEMKLSAVSLTGSQAGLHTDGNHGAAEITALHRRRILRELEDGKIVVVAGFQGIDRCGDITTLGRGGSDTTAVALAAAFDACGCRICTDVDGVYERDPRQFPESRRHEFISYDEMLAMAENGAKVLHPRSVFLARRYRVPLSVLRTGTESPATVVGQQEHRRHSLAADTTFLFR